MGKLYWKFFLFFFLAQLTAVIGVGMAAWLANQKLASQYAQIEASPPAKSMVDAAAATLKAAGVDGLHLLLEDWAHIPMPQVYAVNEAGQELQGRHLPTIVIQTAHEIWAEKSDEQRSAIKNNAKYLRSPVKQILANDGHHYLIFVPTIKYQQLHQTNISDPSIFSALGFIIKPKTRHLFPLIPILVGVLASFIFAALLAWHFSKPINQLKQAFASAANGDLDVRVSNKMADRRDELADLGTAFDVMATRLRVLMQSQTHLLHQVSHELRSPLARLQIAVGLARQQPDKIESSLQRIERESTRMDSLVGELLELSRLESGVMQMDIEQLDINELLETIVEDARFEGAAKEMLVEYIFANHPDNSASQNLVVQGQQDLLHRAIDNIVRNALKYSPSNSVIHILCGAKVVNKDKFVNIQVRDQGPGVAPDELNAIFDAFFRGSKTNEAVGHGVGLAIAKQVIEAHGGQIVARNQAGGGLVVEINLPV